MRQNKHDGLVNQLRDELIQSHDYEKMWLFWTYCKGEHVGEVDLLAMAKDVYDFYEVKCRHHTKAIRTAHKQYERFKLAFPKWTTNGFIYTGDKGLDIL